ncbi:MAG: bacteriophage holin [Gemmatimonadota bacterium]
MKLHVKAMALAAGILWGGGIFFVGIAALIWPGYGDALLRFADSIYPGYHPGGFGSVIVGTLYGLLDGAVGGAILAWLYNRFSCECAAESAGRPAEPERAVTF